MASRLSSTDRTPARSPDPPATPPRAVRALACLAPALLGLPAAVLSAPPTVNDGFASQVTAFGTTTHALLSDGSLVVGGDLLGVAGSTPRRMFRFHADGTRDASFDPAPDDTVFVLLEQPDGRLLVGGRFSEIAGQPRTSIARLFPDGTIDPTFDPVMTASCCSPYVQDLALQPDGKILVAGTFSSLAGVAVEGLGRLRPDGSYDTGFDPPDDLVDVRAVGVEPAGTLLIGGGFGLPSPVRSLARLRADGSVDDSFAPGSLGTVDAIALQADGAILVGGSAVHPVSLGHLARFDREGTLDPGLDPEIGDGFSRVRAITIQADGRILIGGNFLEVEGEERRGAARLHADGSLDPSLVPDYGSTSSMDPSEITEQADGRFLLSGGGGARRLNADGTRDLTLDSGPDNFVFAMGVQPDGRIVLGGAFEYLAGERHVGLGRLRANGTLDAGFTASVESATMSFERVLSLAVQADRKIVVGGSFDALSGTPRLNLGRVDAAGTLDAGFAPLGANGAVSALALEADGDVLVGGSFTQLQGSPRSRLGRLSASGELDAVFQPPVNGDVFALAVQPDGGILVGGSYTQLGGELRQNLGRLHPDGTVDDDFDPLPDGWVHTIVVQPDGKILVGGYFRSIAGGDRDFVARLHADGSLDEEFDGGVIAPSTSRVLALALQTDGRILVGGAFSQVQGSTRWGIGRLHPDGTLDQDFDLGFLAGLANPGQILAFAVQPDARILAAGFFTAVGGAPRDSIVRILDAPAPPNPIQRLEVRSDGVTWSRSGGPELDRVALEASPDGSSWIEVGAMTRAGAKDWELAVEPPTGALVHFRARGSFGPGSRSVVESGRAAWIPVDSDGDGLPDEHELLWGLDPEDPFDADLDPDGDGLTSLDEHLLHPWLDPTDPDTDDDAIDDRLDANPLLPDNSCTGGTRDDATFGELVTGARTCAAVASIAVEDSAEIGATGDLLLVAPRVVFEAGFRASGRLRVISAHPCDACPE